MPPSRCWTLLRLPSTLTTEFATTAPFNGAVAAQVPITPKNSATIAQPAMAGPRIESLGGTRSIAPVGTEGLPARFCFTIRSSRLPWSVPFSRCSLYSWGWHTACQLCDHLGPRSEYFHRSIPDQQKLVDNAQRRGSMGNYHHGDPMFLEFENTI